METAVPCASSTKLVRLTAVVMLAACTRSAPDLPPDYGSVRPANPLTIEDFPAYMQALDCGQTDARQVELTELNNRATDVIESNRNRNQVAVYFAALFLVPIIAVDSDEEQKAMLDRNQAELDHLAQLRRVKDCNG